GGVGVIVGETMGLAGDRIGHFGAAIAYVHAIKAGKAIDQGFAGRIGDSDPLAGFDHDRVAELARRKIPELSERMQGAGAIERGNPGQIAHTDLLVISSGREVAKAKIFELHEFGEAVPRTLAAY